MFTYCFVLCRGGRINYELLRVSHHEHLLCHDSSGALQAFLMSSCGRHHYVLLRVLHQKNYLCIFVVYVSFMFRNYFCHCVALVLRCFVLCSGIGFAYVLRRKNSLSIDFYSVAADEGVLSWGVGITFLIVLVLVLLLCRKRIFGSCVSVCMCLYGCLFLWFYSGGAS